MLGKSQNIWAIYYFFFIMNTRKKNLTCKMVSHNEISQKGRKNKSKQIFPIRKIFSLKFSFWNSEKWEKDHAHPNISVYSLVTVLSASLLFHSVCAYLISHFHFHAYEQAGTTSTHRNRMSYAYTMFSWRRKFWWKLGKHIHLIGIQFVNFSAVSWKTENYLRRINEQFHTTLVCFLLFPVLLCYAW